MALNKDERKEVSSIVDTKVTRTVKPLISRTNAAIDLFTEINETIENNITDITALETTVDTPTTGLVDKVTTLETTKEDHETRITNAEDLLDSVPGATSIRPRFIVYYSTPEAVNDYWNKAQAGEFFGSNYDVVVFADGLQFNCNSYYQSTIDIITKIHEINPRCKVIGYVDLSESLHNRPLSYKKDTFYTGSPNSFDTTLGSDSGTYETEALFDTDILEGEYNALKTSNDPSYTSYFSILYAVDKWIESGVDGIFFDDYGYDYAKNVDLYTPASSGRNVLSGIGGLTGGILGYDYRKRQNIAVDYVHSKNTWAGIKAFVMANAWNQQDVFDTLENPQNPHGPLTILNTPESRTDSVYSILGENLHKSTYDSNGIKTVHDYKDYNLDNIPTKMCSVEGITDYIMLESWNVNTEEPDNGQWGWFPIGFLHLGNMVEYANVSLTYRIYFNNIINNPSGGKLKIVAHSYAGFDELSPVQAHFYFKMMETASMIFSLDCYGLSWYHNSSSGPGAKQAYVADYNPGYYEFYVDNPSIDYDSTNKTVSRGSLLLKAKRDNGTYLLDTIRDYYYIQSGNTVTKTFYDTVNGKTYLNVDNFYNDEQSIVLPLRNASGVIQDAFNLTVTKTVDIYVEYNTGATIEYVSKTSPEANAYIGYFKVNYTNHGFSDGDIIELIMTTTAIENPELLGFKTITDVTTNAFYFYTSKTFYYDPKFMLDGVTPIKLRKYLYDTNIKLKNVYNGNQNTVMEMVGDTVYVSGDIIANNRSVFNLLEEGKLAVGKTYNNSWLYNDSVFPKTTTDMKAALTLDSYHALNEAVRYHTGAIIGNYVYIFGGYNSNASSTIQRISINNLLYTDSDLNIDFEDVGDLPTPLFDSCCLTIGNYVYLFGGQNASYGILNKVYRAPISDPTSWVDTNATGFPSIRAHKCIVVGDYIYCMGGSTTTDQSGRSAAIYSAPVSNPTKWSNTNSTLPVALTQFNICQADGYIYIFGGRLASTTSQIIYRASVDTPTSFSSTWIVNNQTIYSGSNVTGVTFRQSLVINGQYIYLIGGYDNSTKIYRAPLVKPSVFTEIATLSSTVVSTLSFVIDGRIFIFGGYISDAASAAVYYSQPSYITQDSGKVGIFNSSPAYNLDVTGTARISSNLLVSGNLTVSGTTTTINTATLDVADKNILVNKGGTTAGSVGSGLNIEGDSAAVVGYIKVSDSDNSLIVLKSPGNSGILTLDINSSKTITVAGALNVEGDSNINQDLTTDATGVQFGTQTLSTSLTSPLIIGGTGTTSTLTLKATSGVGTTNSDIIFLVGNNGGTEAMRILNSGKVGIGTAPHSNTIMHVKKASSGQTPHADSILTLEDSYDYIWISMLGPNTSTQGILFGDSAANWRGQLSYDHNTDAMYFKTSGVEKLRITSSGNIESTQSENTSSGFNLLLNNTSAATNSLVQLKMYAASTVKSRLITDGLGTGVIVGGGFWMGTETAHPIVFATNDSEKMRITSAGLINLGNYNAGFAQVTIAKQTATTGTTVANNYLHLGGADYVASYKTRIGLGYAGNASHYTPAYFGFVDTSPGAAETYGDLVFGTRSVETGTTEPTERLRITSAGRIGINETSPDTYLHVTTTTTGYASQVKLENTDTAATSFAGLELKTGHSADSSIISMSGNDAGGASARGYAADRLNIENNASGGIAISASHASGIVTAFTNGAERLRITSAGILLVGQRTSSQGVYQGNLTEGVQFCNSVASSFAPTTASGDSVLFLRNTDETYGTANRYVGITFSVASQYGNFSAGAAACIHGVATSTTTPGLDTVFSCRKHDASFHETMRITSAGNVGIGTNAPDYTLHIVGTGYFSGAVTCNSSLTVNGDFTVNGTTTNINTTNLVVEDKNIILADVTSPSDTTADGGGITLKGATDKTILWSNSSGLWEFNKGVYVAGNVGIGTTTPGSLLEIRQDSSSDINYSLILNNASELNTTNFGSGIKLYAGGSNTNKWAGIASIATSAFGNQNALIFLTGKDLSTPTEKMRITTDGRLLVGNTSFSANGAGHQFSIDDATQFDAVNGGLGHQVLVLHNKNTSYATVNRVAGLTFRVETTYGGAVAGIYGVAPADDEGMDTVFACRKNDQSFHETMRITSAGDIIIKTNGLYLTNGNYTTGIFNTDITTTNTVLNYRTFNATRLLDFGASLTLTNTGSTTNRTFIVDLRDADRKLDLKGDFTLANTNGTTGTLTVDLNNGSRSISLSANLTVSGTTNISNTLTVSGATSITSSLTVDGVSSINQSVKTNATPTFAGMSFGSNNVILTSGILSCGDYHSNALGIYGQPPAVKHYDLNTYNTDTLVMDFSPNAAPGAINTNFIHTRFTIGDYGDSSTYGSDIALNVHRVNNLALNVLTNTLNTSCHMFKIHGGTWNNGDTDLLWFDDYGRLTINKGKEINGGVFYKTSTSYLECWSYYGGLTYDTLTLVIDADGTVRNNNGTYTNGADYAEYFEWEDGNINNEDRTGCVVTLINSKIKVREENEMALGVISATPSVVGDSNDLKWNKKYLTDKFGRKLKQTIYFYTWKEIGENNIEKTITVKKDDVEIEDLPENYEIINDEQDILNPDYDPNVEYIPRSKRKEWVIVGLLGKLVVRKDQVIPDHWIKMEDIDNEVARYFIK